MARDSYTRYPRPLLWLVQGGTIAVGGPEADAQPRFAAAVEPFYIGKFPVTNEQFEAFDPGFERSPLSAGDRDPAAGVRYSAAASRIPVVDLVRPVLEELSQKTGETVDLAVFRDDHMLFIDQVVGTHRLRAVSAVGEVFPMTTTANGKAALALLDDEAVHAIATRELEARGGSKRAIRQLRLEIDRVREAGFALDLDEHTEGISAVGVAFTTPTGLIYAISIPVPSQRFARLRDSLAEVLLDALESVRATL